MRLLGTAARGDLRGSLDARVQMRLDHLSFPRVLTLSFICISVAWSEFGSIFIQSGTLLSGPEPPGPLFFALISTSPSLSGFWLALPLGLVLFLGASKNPRRSPFFCAAPAGNVANRPGAQSK